MFTNNRNSKTGRFFELTISATVLIVFFIQALQAKGGLDLFLFPCALMMGASIAVWLSLSSPPPKEETMVIELKPNPSGDGYVLTITQNTEIKIEDVLIEHRTDGTDPETRY